MAVDLFHVNRDRKKKTVFVKIVVDYKHFIIIRMSDAKDMTFQAVSPSDATSNDNFVWVVYSVCRANKLSTTDNWKCHRSLTTARVAAYELIYHPCEYCAK